MEDKTSKNKKQLVIGLSILLLVTLLLLGLTYAYYRTNIIGNSGEKSVSLVAKNLEVTYGEDSSSVITETVTPGSTYTKTFSVTNTGTIGEIVEFSIILDNKSSTFDRMSDWVYELSETGTGTGPLASGIISKASKQVIYAKDSLGSKGVKNYTLKVEYKSLDDINQSIDMGKKMNFRVNIDEPYTTWDNAEEGTLLYAIKQSRNSMSTNPLTIPGQQESTDTEKVLAETEDDYGKSYYYRGNVDNNFLNFGGMCWRIVRVQGDSSIKITLADRGNECDADGYAITNTKTAFTADNLTYTYFTKSKDGLSLDSFRYSSGNFPEMLDQWMEENKLINNANIETTALWCMDLSISRQPEGENSKEFGAYGRLSTVESAQPSLKCSFTGINDSISETYEKGYALLTADEIAFSGSTFSDKNSSSYLKYNTTNEYYGYWTMTPRNYIATSSYSTDPTVFAATSDGKMSYSPTTMGYAFIRPTVVLKSNVQVTGSGQQNDPYVVK